MVALGEPYASAVEAGFGALSNAARHKVQIIDPRRLTGSIDLDATLASDPNHARKARWDYGVGFKTGTTHERCAVWVELHGANPGALADMKKKRAWLREWLQNSSPELRSMTTNAERHLCQSPYVWISTGTNTILKTSTSSRALAASGVNYPTKFLKLP